MDCHESNTSPPSSSPSSNGLHQMVIIGASFGGISTAHGLIRDVFPALSRYDNKKYQVVLLAPNDQFFWMVGAPRTVAKPQALPLKDLLVPIADGFKQYAQDSYKFIYGNAVSIDPGTRTVTTSTNEYVHYDSLIIASGVRYTSPIWTISHGLGALEAGFAKLHDALPPASSVLVSGGGPAGTETAGELGEAYGGNKALTLLSGSPQLLSRLTNKKLGNDAEAKLSRLGVDVIHNLRVVSSEKNVDGQTILRLSDGSERTVDVYIDATGGRPNNSFIPDSWLNAKGFVKTDVSTLRLDVPKVQDVYCIGSVCSYAIGNVFDSKFAVKSMLETIRLDLTAHSSGRKKTFHKPMTSDMQLVPIGSKQGVGVTFGWRLPEFAVVFAKSKDYMIKDAVKLVRGSS